MPEPDRPPAVVSRLHRRVEQVGVLLLLAAFGFFLWQSHQLIAWADPAAGYHFGRHFPEHFGDARLAYGFPLLVHGAVALAGPVWAFLINLPLLILMAGLLYAMAWSLVPRESSAEARLGLLAGAVTVGLLILLAPELLIELVSPYRDPLAHVFVLAACLLVLRYASGRERSFAWLLGAGASLALATATRESAGLMLLPFLLFALAARRECPLLPAVLVFAASFAVFCVPTLVHNHGASGHFWMPAQAATGSGEDGSPAPGLGPGDLASAFPLTLAYLWGHYRWPTLLLAGLGLAAGVWRRRPAVYALLVPAWAVFLLFHGGSGARVPRTLLVLDLFVLPLAGVGAAALAASLLRPLGAGRLAEAAATGLGVLAVLGAAGLALDAARPPERGFRIADALALRNHVDALVPGDAVIVGERPIAEVLRSFVARSERVVLLRPRRVFADASLRERLRQTVDAAPEAYLVSQQELLRRFLEREFDLELLASFPAASYGFVDDPEARLHVERIRPWSRLETRVPLAPAPAGPRLLRVDVGHLSGRERGWAHLYWNDERLDARPRDGNNYYRVEVADAVQPSFLVLRSDRPVPSRLDVELQPPQRAIAMNFDAEDTLQDRGRLSADFFAEPGDRYPMLRERGGLDVPTPDPSGAVFVGVAEVGLRRGHQSGRHTISVGTPLGPFYRLELRGEEGADTRSTWHRISFAFHEPLVTDRETRLIWSYRGPELENGSPALALRSLDLYRLELAPELVLQLGRLDEPYLLDGFGAPEALRDPPLSFRATGPRAELRIPLTPDPRPARLELRYLSGLRPRSAPPPDPEVLWNQVPLQGSVQQEPAGFRQLTRVTAHYELPGAPLQRALNQLVIRATPWEGRGILLERVAVQRVAPAAED